MKKFFKSLYMRFEVRFAVGGMLYRPRNQFPSLLTSEMCYENLPPSANEISYTGSYYWLAADWFTCCQRYRILEKGLWNFEENTRFGFLRYGLKLFITSKKFIFELWYCASSLQKRSPKKLNPLFPMLHLCRTWLY